MSFVEGGRWKRGLEPTMRTDTPGWQDSHALRAGCYCAGVLRCSGGQARWDGGAGMRRGVGPEAVPGAGREGGFLRTKPRYASKGVSGDSSCPSEVSLEGEGP